MRQNVRGWRKDTWDGRDYLHKVAMPTAIPDVVDLSKYCPGVRNQGGVGSCTGFGIGANITAAAKKSGVYTEWFSPWWIYNGARYIEGDLRYDNGAYPRDCLDWLVKKGCLLEHFWPYQDGTSKLDTTSPPSKFDPEAAKWPLVGYSDAPQLKLGYYRVTAGADGICSALAQEKLVSIGIPWPSKWMSSKDGVLPAITASSSIAGGHEVVLYGYDKTKGLFCGMNSWGTTQWSYTGKVIPKGCFTMPMSVFEVFKKLGGYDAHYVEVKWGALEPPVPPTPVSEVLIQVSLDDGQSWVSYGRTD